MNFPFPALRRLISRVHRKIGYRGMFLALLGAIDILLGAYLLVSRLPPAPGVVVLGESAWGGVWIGAGLFLFTGAPATRDQWHFAAAALLKTAWAGEFARLAIIRHAANHWLWLLAAAWILVAATVLLISTWPETRK